MVLLVLWLLLAVALVWAWRTVEWLYLKPKRLNHALRKQGLKGNSYRLFDGDLKETFRLTQEARSRPMPLFSHDIAPRVLPLVHNAIKEHGKISFTWVGPFPRVTLMDPELIRIVLSNKFGHFGKPNFSPVTRALARGLASYEGDKWAKHRRIINPAFHAEKLKCMLPAFSTCCAELVNRWEKRIKLDGNYLELDVWPELQNFTGDVISRTAFGSSYDEGKRIFQLQAEQAELVFEAFQKVYIPGHRFLPTARNIRRRQISREITRMLRSMIEKREKAIRMGDSLKDDLLGLLMESNLKEVEGNFKNKGMTTEDIIQECKLFYFAGQETTALLLTWTMILLSMYPDWQVRAREEVLQVFGKSEPHIEGLSHLKIVTMVLYEALRLYPPATFMMRRTYKTVELGGISYPPGLILMLPLVFVHHAVEFWGENAKEFTPSRFAQGVSKASKVQGAFFPFGGGPRICIGQSFTLIEAKMALTVILQRFAFELSPSYIHAPYTMFSLLRPQHGAQIKLHRL